MYWLDLNYIALEIAQAREATRIASHQIMAGCQYLLWIKLHGSIVSLISWKPFQWNPDWLSGFRSFDWLSRFCNFRVSCLVNVCHTTIRYKHWGVWLADLTFYLTCEPQTWCADIVWTSLWKGSSRPRCGSRGWRTILVGRSHIPISSSYRAVC